MMMLRVVSKKSNLLRPVTLRCLATQAPPEEKAPTKKGLFSKGPKAQPQQRQEPKGSMASGSMFSKR